MADALLPWPCLTSRPDVAASATALYGPGIVLFGEAITDALQHHAESTDGIPSPELSDVVLSCGGAAKWHAFVANYITKINAQPGGLIFNCFKLGTSAGGPFGMCCLTCGGKSTALCKSHVKSPFQNALRHVEGTAHEKARDSLIAQVEQAASASGIPRAEVAMQMLAERIGMAFTEELPRVELQPVGCEPLRSLELRSCAWSSVSPGQPATKQEQLDAKVGSGAYEVNDDNSLAACQRCSRHKRKLIHLANPNWLKNACVHYDTHCRPNNGMQRLELFGIKACSSRLCDSIPKLAFKPDYSSRCHGFWLESYTYGDTTYDTGVLMNDWKPGPCWSAQPRFKATVVQERTSESQELFSMQGSTVQWQWDGIAAAGVVLGYETPTLMYVRPDASSAPGLREAGQLFDRRYAMVNESEVSRETTYAPSTLRCPLTFPLPSAHAGSYCDAQRSGYVSTR